MVIPPAEIDVTPRRGPGSHREAFVTQDGRRPANLVFHAPDSITAATDFTIDLFFGLDPNRANMKKISLTITVNPRP